MSNQVKSLPLLGQGSPPPQFTPELPDKTKNANQHCGISFGPATNNATGPNILCVNYGSRHYICPKKSCHTGKEAERVNPNNIFEKNFFFESCTNNNASAPFRNAVTLWPESYTADNFGGSVYAILSKELLFTRVPLLVIGIRLVILTLSVHGVLIATQHWKRVNKTPKLLLIRHP
ncbi:hypothetical protein O181_024987 [Austropuccinia psidii MF-1]|uniref:Uncharacterized protein n=1 Tax=Austropuccinia psidii MF-1 TaxID=1389203 RepID=A0A9Q3CKA9_9BASI|nr:hypothetical protein [Austropuccinia psidii MF-1]